MKGDYADRTVCFIDLLGFSEAVTIASRSDEEMKQISKLISGVKDVVINNYDRTELVFQNLSDSIFISTPSNDRDHIEDLILCIQDLTIYFLTNGFAIRGGIASGKCHVTPEIILGEPVVKAVKIESNVAVFPRVALSKSTQLLIKENTALYDKVVRRDEDGIFWIDPFSSAFRALERNHQKWVEAKNNQESDAVRYRTHVDKILGDMNSVITFVQDNIDQISENKSVFEKYYWLARKVDRSSELPRLQVGSELKEIDLTL